MSTPLVGRNAAWVQLQQQWQQIVQQGRKEPTPHVVMVNGEAGIGKTRLVEELVTAVRSQGNATAVAHCYPAGGRLAYAPLQSWLRTPDVERHRHNLPPLLQQGLARLLPELAVDVPANEEPSPMTDAANRRRLFEAVLAALTVAETPLLLVLDDIQWSDRDTLEWLEFLLYGKVAVPLLVVATLRSEEFTGTDALAHLCSTLERTGHLTTVGLSRLTAAETAELAANLTGQTSQQMAENQIFQETDGIPLFIVETVRATLQKAETATEDAGPGTHERSHANPLPPKIQAVVEHRLVRLSPDARALANLAAVVGRAFSAELLAGASTLGEDELVQGLDELWQQQLIQEQTSSHDESYIFAHDKLREVVYGLLSPMRRRLLHRRVAEALDVLATERAQDASAQIALHHELAGQPLVAIKWLLRAAQVAHRLSALQDALTHLEQAERLLQALRDDVDAGALDALELPLQMQRGALLLVTKGYAAPEVEKALTRALHLCANGGTPAQRFGVLWGLGRYYLVKPDLEKGLEVSQRLLQLAEVSRSVDLLVEAYTTVGTYQLHRAELREALRYFDQALSLYDQDQHGNHTVTYGQDPAVVSLSYSAWAHWCLGETATAKRQTNEALALAEELGYPYNQVIAQTYAAAQFQYMGDVEQCLQGARAASALATEHGFILWQAMADFLQGWSHAQRGDLSMGMDLMQRSALLFQSTGAELGACYFAALLAAVLGEQGQIEPATVAINHAFELLERTQDRWCAAEIHRIHGQLLLLQAPDDGDAAAAFERGLQIAQAQGAEWWAERCRQSLAQLAV